MALEEAAFGHRVVIHAMDWTLVLLDERVEGSFAEWMERRRLGGNRCCGDRSGGGPESLGFAFRRESAFQTLGLRRDCCQCSQSDVTATGEVVLGEVIEVGIKSTEEGEALRGFRVGLPGVLAAEGKFTDTTRKLERFFIRLLSQLGPVSEHQGECHYVVWLILVVQGLEELQTLALKLLVAAHEDETGFLVDGIDEALVEALGEIDGIGGGDQWCGTQGRKTTAPRGVETASEELGNPPRPIFWIVELLELRVQFSGGLLLETGLGELVSELSGDVRTGSGITLRRCDGTRRWRYHVGMTESDGVDRAVDVDRCVVDALVIGGRARRGGRFRGSVEVLLTSWLRWMGVGWGCRDVGGAWGELLMVLGWRTETADHLVVGRFIGETNIGHGCVIIVSRLVFRAWVVGNTCPTSCPGTEDAAFVAVEDRIVQVSTALGGPVLGEEGFSGERVWKSFNDRRVVKCPLLAFVNKPDRGDDGSCGPHNLRKKVACRTMVGGWLGDGRKRAVGWVVRGWQGDLLKLGSELGDGRRRIGSLVEGMDRCGCIK